MTNKEWCLNCPDEWMSVRIFSNAAQAPHNDPRQLHSPSYSLPLFVFMKHFTVTLCVDRIRKQLLSWQTRVFHIPQSQSCCFLLDPWSHATSSVSETFTCMYILCSWRIQQIHVHLHGLFSVSRFEMLLPSELILWDHHRETPHNKQTDELYEWSIVKLLHWILW